MHVTYILIQLVLLPSSIAFNCLPKCRVLPKTPNTSVLYQESPKSASALWKDLNLSRRDAVIFSIGGVVYGKLVGDVLARILRGDHYPQEHEGYVSTTFEKTITAAANRLSTSSPSRLKNESTLQLDRRPLRVLEVGIGTTCRTVVSGMYDEALAKLSDSQASSSNPSLYPVTRIDIVGADIDIPKPDVLRKAQDKLSATGGSDLIASLEVIEGDITDKLPFPDGYFDAITCSLVLCSVRNQELALNEIKRLLNPNGGVFGYIEHVAVQLDIKDEKKKRSFLEWQQRTLDPLQQLVAHNCHLHRETDAAVMDIFAVPEMSSQVLYRERFFVDDMWPVSCQCCGVIALDSKIK